MKEARLIINNAMYKYLFSEEVRELLQMSPYQTTNHIAGFGISTIACNIIKETSGTNKNGFCCSITYDSLTTKITLPEIEEIIRLSR